MLCLPAVFPGQPSCVRQGCLAEISAENREKNSIIDQGYYLERGSGVCHKACHATGNTVLPGKETK
jgi:hypothetical protein